MNQSVIGWCDTYNSGRKTTTYTAEHKKALVERIRQRRYSFNYNDFQYLPYCCPVYDDGAICILTKQQFDTAMEEAWKDMPIGARLMPMDVITIKKNNTLFEKQKFADKEDCANV
jgi:hypothetical protein